MLAERDGFDEATARTQATDVLRLAAAYVESHGVEGLRPPRVEHLVRSARARLFLRETFEKEFSLESIPEGVVTGERELGRRVHPTVLMVCQILVKPPHTDGGTKVTQRPDDPAWLAKAEALSDRAAERFTALFPDPGAEPDCEQMTRVLQSSPDLLAGTDDTMELKIETGLYDPCGELWVEGFRTAMCGVEETGWSPRFETELAVHRVAVVEVYPSNMPTDGDLEMAIRRDLIAEWRGRNYQDYVARIAQKHDVRVADDDAPAESPPPP